MSQTLERMSTLDAEFFYAEHHNVPNAPAGRGPRSVPPGQAAAWPRSARSGRRWAADPWGGSSG
jgi:hypothetical protein